MRDKSRISVRHTTNESMLKPRPAKIPDTRESTPGSFCTRQLSTCLHAHREAKPQPHQHHSKPQTRGTTTHFLNGCILGGGVLYRMFVTASSALRRGRSMAGSGGGRCFIVCL